MLSFSEHIHIEGLSNEQRTTLCGHTEGKNRAWELSFSEHIHIDGLSNERRTMLC